MSNESFAPGVRVIEAAPVSQPANPGPTLTGIAGVSNRGRVDVAQLITQWSEYVSLYGGYSANVDLGVFAQDYFANGGSSLRVLRIAAGDAVGASNTADLLTRDGAVVAAVHAISPGEWGNSLAVKTALLDVSSTALQTYNDSNGNELPNNSNNGDSVSVAYIPVDDINALGVGDVVDIFDSAGAYETTTVVLGVDAAGRAVIVDLGGAPDDVAVGGAGSHLRSASQHRTRVLGLESLADGAENLLLNSTIGINAGTLMTAMIYSHCETIPARGMAGRSSVIVSRIAGDRVYFTAPAVTTFNATLPATTNAAIRYVSETVGSHIDLVATAAGPAGNKVSLKVVTGALANTVTVSGKTIVINTDGTFTLAQVKTAIEANAQASALVTATVTGTTTKQCVDALASTRLTGGANLMLVSQEFGMEVYLGADLAERHDYLSTISTSPDYIGARLGGDPDTFTPVSGGQSAFLIFDGLDAVVGTADAEFLTQPRALVSVGLAEGSDGSALTDADWIGGASPNTGLTLLAGYEDLKLLIAPGVTSPDVQNAMNDLAASSGRVVALLDAPLEASNATAVLTHRVNDLGINDRFVQLANTWAKVRDKRSGSLRGALITIPATPGWAALIAQGQAEIGPHGSPGGRVPQTWVELTFNPSQSDAGLLDKNGVSVFRVVSGQIKCFGDNTLLQTEDPRQFGNVSRMLNQLIHDLESDLSPVIFSPGNETVFPRVESILNKRLLQYHRAGALYPQADPKQAFSVACNATTTSLQDIARGQFFAEVVLSPSTLVKQIVLRLAVSAGGVSIANNA